jgi:Leucine-rich repeat (LRR) protein
LLLNFITIPLENFIFPEHNVCYMTEFYLNHQNFALNLKKTSWPISKFMLSTLVFMLFSLGFHHQSEAQISNAERSALIAIYNALDGDNWTTKTNWKTGASFSAGGTENTWYGITVTNIGGLDYVTEINLPANNLKGTIPSQIWNFTNLNTLNIASNAVIGSIPTNPPSGLVAFNFNYNGLFTTNPGLISTLATINADTMLSYQTVVPQNITTEFVSTSSVKVKWDAIDYTEGPGYYQIVYGSTQGNPSDTVITANKLAEEVVLTGLTLGTRYYFKVRTITQANANNTSVVISPFSSEKSFNMAIPLSERNALIAFYDSLNGNGWTTSTNWKVGGNFNASGTEGTWFGVTIGLGDTSLVVKELRLVSNNLSGKLPSNINAFSAIEVLKLDSNQISGKIPTQIGSLSTLKHLALGVNQLSDSIPASLGTLSNLEILALNNNRLRGNIPVALGDLSNLQSLTLQGNQLVGDIPTSFSNLSSLSLLNLTFNGLIASDAGVDAFVTGLQGLWKDTQTIAPGNVVATPVSATQAKLTWTPVSYVFNPGGYLVKYGKKTGIYTDSVLVSGKDKTTVTISNLQADSTYFYVVQSYTNPHANNGNTIYSLNSTERSVKLLPKLLPAERAALIALYNNTLGDSWTSKTNWKDTLGNFGAEGSEATWFGVSTQRINDTLRVTQIRLAANNLRGKLPTELGNLSRLSLLELNTNQITDSIPANLGNLKNVAIFDLAKNRLVGGLPASLGALTSCVVFDVSANNLVGEIPAAIANIPGANAFQIRYNGLFSTNSATVAAIDLKDPVWQLSQTVYPKNIIATLQNPFSLRLNWDIVDYLSDPGNYFIYVGTQSGVYSDTITINQKVINQHDFTVEPGKTYYISIRTRTAANANNSNVVLSALSPELVFANPNVISIEERNALIAIYNATAGAQWTNKNNWLGVLQDFAPRGSEGTWFGVTVESIEGGKIGVTGLQLPSNNLVGSLPAAIGDLVNLKTLRLDNNKIAGDLPEELATISSLTSVRLDRNAFIGAIPAGIKDITGINTLNLRYNGLFSADAALTTYLNSKDADWRNTQTVAPGNINATIVSPTSATISWTAIPYTADGGFYRIHYGTESGVYSTSIETANKSNNSLTLNGLSASSTYYLKIETFTPAHANNSNAITSERSPELVFTSFPNPPAQVVLTSPANGAKNIDISTNLVWQETAVTTQYVVQLSSSIDFTGTVDVTQLLINDTIPETSLAINLANNTTYNWRVRARNNGGFGPWSVVRNFKTKLATPLLLSPGDPACLPLVATTFEWSATAGASKYQFQVSTDPGFTTLFKNLQALSGTNTSLNDLEANTTYYWRVKASNDDGDESNWSAISRFRTYSPVAASGVLSFCEGGQVTLTAPLGLSYQWLRNGNPIASATSQQLVANESGVYTVQVNSSIGCVYTSESVTVTVNPLPTATISFTGTAEVCEGQTKILTASAGASYRWFRNGEVIANATSQSIEINTGGSYTVEVTSAAGCTRLSAAQTINVVAIPTASITAGGSLNFCSGGSVVLTASLGASYQWFKDGVAIDGATQRNYTAFTTGNYAVNVSNSLGCGNTSAGVQVTVTPIPTATITISGQTAICQGETTTLTASEGASYQWFRNGVAIAGATNRSIIVSQTGSYSVEVANSPLCKALSLPVVITVGVLPTATMTANGPLSFCQGQSVQFTANSASAYQWFKDGQPIAGATQQTYTANAAGAYSVRVSNASGCSAVSLPQTVSVTPLPVATINPSGSLTVCQNTALTLTAPDGGGSYQWLRNGVEIAGATTRFYSVTQSGNYQIRVTNGTNCTVTSANTTVLVEATPPANITQNGPELRAPAGNFDYQWYKNGQPISGATQQIFTTFESGTYSVRVTAKTGNLCSALSQEVVLTITSIEDENVNPNLLFNAYPNPVSSQLMVKVRKTSRVEDPKMKLYTLDGRLLGSYTMNDEGDYYRGIIEMSLFSSGQYMVIVETKQKVYRKSILKR